jgi:hypothetical protein
MEKDIGVEDKYLGLVRVLFLFRQEKRIASG